MKRTLLLFLAFIALKATAQVSPQKRWVDSVFAKLTPDQKIAQLMVVRLSEKGTKGPVFFDAKVMDLVKKYNIGGVCLFQGNPHLQATLINKLQKAAKTPILMCVDGENGLGMRFDSIVPLNRQMMLGAIQDKTVIYEYGKWVGKQCKRIGIHVNYAPVVDVNNNPLNPIINDRSFGEDKYQVATLGIAYMEGMQSEGVMACAKHFPGHGDVTVDSHKDLPVINKTMAQLDSLELYPFKQIFNAGVGSVMIAHLSIPAIDATANKPTSISYKNVTELMRQKLNYQGLSFTDALEMQGVKKFYPAGEAAVQSIIAGNDMLCLPEDVATAITKIKEAIKKKRLTWADIELHVRKVLESKYQYGLAKMKPIVLENLTADLNAETAALKRKIAEHAITMINPYSNTIFPLEVPKKNRVAYVCIGDSNGNTMSKAAQEQYNAEVFHFTYRQSKAEATALYNRIIAEYKNVIIGMHGYARVPANNFGISAAAADLVNDLQQKTEAVTFVFGNPYALKNIKQHKNLVLCYENDMITQSVAAKVLSGDLKPKGKLPVTVAPELKFGSGYISQVFFYPKATPMTLGWTPFDLTLSTP